MSYVRKILNDIKFNEENRICVDCKAGEAMYVSINNGVFLCYQCADYHSSLGKQISFIRNLEDTFDEYLILYLIRGGNFRYKNFLFDSGINCVKKNSQQAYFTKGMDYYRINVIKYI